VHPHAKTPEILDIAREWGARGRKRLLPFSRLKDSGPRIMETVGAAGMQAGPAFVRGDCWAGPSAAFATACVGYSATHMRRACGIDSMFAVPPVAELDAQRVRQAFAR
jgi:hypothetical protein